ncbi:hypothetical protein BYT27DRAFT_7208274 [Phlegmacium glaucopus]|nr:hypothetical protein BYT27DRAFT_7208274 [Phlegmacium glaucopus]
MQREQDSLNPHTHANIMVLLQEDSPSAHPYWYTHIIGIYHTLIHHKSSPDPILIAFLWICWYGLDLDRSSWFGWKACRLAKVGFVPNTPDAGSPAFGFLNPAQRGLTGDLLEPLLAWLPDEGDLDWRCYYVNVFIDCDMLMHFREQDNGLTQGGHDEDEHGFNADAVDEDSEAMDNLNDDNSENELQSGRDDDLGGGGSDDDKEDLRGSGKDSYGIIGDAENDKGSCNEEEDYGYSYSIDDSEDGDNSDTVPDLSDDALGPEDGKGDVDEVNLLKFAVF